MLGDLRVLATDDELLLDTERVALQPLFNMIRRYSLGYDVELHKRTLECGLLGLHRPAGRMRSIAAFAAEALPGPAEHDHVAAALDSAPRSRDPHRCRHRPAVRRRAISTRFATQLVAAGAVAVGLEAAPSACGSSTGARATASTSTRP